jgi:hypothetical protein
MIDSAIEALEKGGCENSGANQFGLEGEQKPFRAFERSSHRGSEP